jgi:hypothetical protein
MSTSELLTFFQYDSLESRDCRFDPCHGQFFFFFSYGLVDISFIFLGYRSMKMAMFAGKSSVAVARGPHLAEHYVINHMYFYYLKDYDSLVVKATRQ